MTSLALDPVYSAWGDHKSRIVRTGKGVYFAFVFLLSNSELDTNETRKFRLYKIDEDVPVMIGGESINGVGVTLVADRDDNPYVSIYSGLSVTSPRGGSSREFFVDVACPVITVPDSTAATDWITFRLNLPHVAH